MTLLCVCCLLVLHCTLKKRKDIFKCINDSFDYSLEDVSVMATTVQ